MTKEEKKILNEFYLGELTQVQFEAKFPASNLSEDYIISKIIEAYSSQNNDDLELYLILPLFHKKSIKDERFVNTLCLLMEEHWHFQHENIALMLQEIKSPQSIDTLYITALTKFEYLNYDDSIPLAIKCIYALGQIKTIDAKNKLKILANNDDPIIKTEASKQLNNY